MEKIRDFLTGVVITLIFILLVGFAGGITNDGNIDDVTVMSQKYEVYYEKEGN